MTTLMNQVTCSFCNIKTNETKLLAHIVSIIHSELCKYDKCTSAINFFDMIFDTIPKKVNFIVWKVNKHLISGDQILQRNYPKKVLIYSVVIQTIIQI